MKHSINNKQLLLPLAVGATMLSACSSPNKTEQVSHPNIVFILADDLGYGDISLFNDSSKINTDNIDKLGREGVCFTDAHSSSSVSTPTRYGILTGRYNWRSDIKQGVLFGYSPALIPAGRQTMASTLKQAGYTTGCVGKWHLGWHWDNIEAGEDSVNFANPITEGPTTLGFDYFYGIAGSLDMAPYVYVENDMPTSLPDRMTENDGMKFWRKGPTGADFDHEQTLPNLITHAEKFIKDNSNKSNPFFLYLPLPAPHTPILPIKEFQGKSGLNPYGDFVLMTDAMVGRIVKTLEEAGVADNTIIIFTSDNGCSPQANFEELQAKGHYPSYIYRGHKADLYDGGHRIPCVLKWGDKVKPHNVNQTICLTDFMRTFASIANIELPDNAGEDSFDLSSVIFNEGEVPTIREATVHHSIDGDFTIRSGKWKLLLCAGSGGWSFPTAQDLKNLKNMPKYQLYDMEADPSETTNVAESNPEIVERLRLLMKKYVDEGRSTPGKPQSNDNVEGWNQLLYWE